MVLWPLLACTPPADTVDGTTPGPGTLADDTASAATGDTGTGGGTPYGPECALLLPPEQMAVTATLAIETEEDFDFDGRGNLLTQRSAALQGIDRGGGSHFVAPFSGGDATGIRSTAEGFVVVAQPDQASVWRVNPTTGASTRLMGMNNPNGVEAGADGMVYVTENAPGGRISMVDPLDGTAVVIAQVNYPNGIVLSPDEQTLYFTSGNAPFAGSVDIMAMERDSGGDWDRRTLRPIHSRSRYVGSITIDACGNLYGLEYSYGLVFRVDTATGVAQDVVQLYHTPFSDFSALHFPPGLGGWDVTSVYVTNRGQLFEIPTGVPGSHVLTP